MGVLITSINMFFFFPPFVLLSVLLTNYTSEQLQETKDGVTALNYGGLEGHSTNCTSADTL